MKSLLKNIIRGLRLIWRLNITKTFFVNFYFLPFSQAIKFPIVVYGKLHIHDKIGKIEIQTNELHFNMIKLGYRWRDLWPISYLPTQLSLLGTIIFRGPAIISGGVNLTSDSKNSIIDFGKYSVIGGGCMVKSLDIIEIGDYSRIAGGCIVMNSNMHFVKDLDSGIIKKREGQIKIGNYCWINPNSIISKGAIIPDYCIAARASFIAKDYSDYGSNLFLVGSPAKVSSKRVQRIFTSSYTKKIQQYFIDNPQAEYYQENPGVISEKLSGIDTF